MSRMIESQRIRRQKTTSRARSWSRSDNGQVTVFVAIIFTLFLAAFAGFGSDMANLWFHRQSAQGAADAACMAGAADMLYNVSTLNGGFGGFSAGTNFDCTTSGNPSPCKYAALNGYSSPGLAVGKDSNQVSVTFPSSVPGITTPATAVAGAFPFIRVDVVDRVKVYFSALLTKSGTADVRATAKCGVIQQPTGPGPIHILHPNAPNALSVQGTPDVRILGGPPRSVIVNSNDQNAIQLGNNAILDLSQAGPNFTGGYVAVFGGPLTAPSKTNFYPGTTGGWESPSAPVQDPLELVPAPTQPPLPQVPPDPYPSQCTTLSNPCIVAYHTNGCPDPLGCMEYGPGYYPATLQVKNATAIFDPGVYYISAVADLSFAANSIVRPSTAVGNGSGGTLFYLSGGSVSIGSNSGVAGGGNIVDDFSTSSIPCPGGVTPNPPLPATIQGNVLVGPCTINGTYQFPPTPQGQYRGILMFQSRSNTGSGAQATMYGGGGLALVGTLYFHNCPNSVNGPCSAPPADYQAVVSLQGNTGTDTRIIGDIIADQVQLGGTSNVYMQLNPNGSWQMAKVAMLQ